MSKAQSGKKSEAAKKPAADPSSGAKLSAWAARQHELAKKNQAYLAMLLEAGVPNMSFRPKDWRNDITCKFWPDCKCGDACPYKHDPAVLENARRLRLEAQQQAASSRRSAAAGRPLGTLGEPST